MQDFNCSTINFKIKTIIDEDEDEELSKEKFYHIPGKIFMRLLFSEYFNKLSVYIGVNTGHAYFGSEGSFYPFHVEDMNLGSINRMYSGEPKIWFCFYSKNYDAVVKYFRCLIFFEINNSIIN